jgi:uncharacterized protein YndB with AHSA1/START domain
MRVEREVVLPVPPDAAWSALTDWERQASWMRDADRVDVISRQREGVGTTVAVRTRVLHVPLFTERLEVVAWDPPRALRIAHRSFVRGVGTWTLEPAGTGTRFRWTEEIALPIPLVGELALLAYRPFMRHLMGGAMRTLRARLAGDAS